MPRVLIAGCGYVGRAAADLFHEAGSRVEGWTKSSVPTDAPYPVIACDVADPADVAAHASDPDIVIHCVSSKGSDADGYRRLYFAGAKNLLATFPRALLLFTSSTSVYAQTTGEWVTEESPAAPTRETAQVLRETEQLVLAQGGTVARLAGIYGPGRSFLFERFMRGSPISLSNRYVNQVHRDDAAAALFLLASKPACGQIFNVADDAPTSLRDCYEWLARYLQKQMPPITAESQPRKRGDGNKRVSNRKLRAYGWKPRYGSFQVGMAESVVPHWNASCSKTPHAPHQT